MALPISHRLLLLAVALLTTPSRNRVDAESLPNKVNMVEDGGQWNKDQIPDNDALARAARLSAIMYQVDSTDSIAWSYSKEVLQPTVFLKNEYGVEAAVVVSPTAETIHVVFRGTDGSMVDVGVDLELQTVPYSDNNDGRTFVKGKVHKGFKKSLMGDVHFLGDLDDAVISALVYHPTFRVELNGHSLGAAQAALYGVHLTTTVMPMEKIRVISIGSPRLGDLDFKNYVNVIPNLAIWRMVNRDDLIPRLPMNIAEYHHAGHLIWFTRDGRMSVYYQQTGLKNIYEGVDSAEWDIDLTSNPLAPVFNHMPWEYEMLVAEIPMSLSSPIDFEPSDGQADTCCFWLATCLRYCAD